MYYIRNYQVFQEKFSAFDKHRPIMLDTETLGLYGDIRLIQLCQDGEVLIVDCLYVEPNLIIEDLLDCHTVSHNCLYDLNLKEFHNKVPAKVDDTMYMARLRYPYLPSHSLKSVLNYLGFDKGDEGKSDWSLETLSEVQLSYAADDVYLLEKIYYQMENILNDMSYILDMKNIRYALNYSRIGLKVNEHNRLNAIKQARELRNLALESLPSTLNINSPKQVKEFLGTKDSSSATLTDLVLLKQDDRAKAVLDARKYTKQLNFLEAKFNTDRVYGYFHPSGAKSGRWTCKEQNLQQLPRELKNVFGFTSEDAKYLVDADYSALEIYCACAYTGEQVMYKMLKEGIDLHTYSASKIFHKPMKDVTKYERQVGKTANFSLMYGASAKTYIAMAKAMAGIVLSLEEATKIRNAWLDTYPTIKAWHRTPEDLNSGKGWTIVKTPLGRRVRANGYNDQLNIPVQGMGAECTKLALMYLYKEIPNVKVCLTVHDSITLECDSKEQAEEYAPILEECMKKGFREMSKFTKIKDLEIGAEAEILKVLG